MAAAFGWRLARWLLPAAGLASQLTCAATMTAAAVVCGATVLGHLGWLWLAPFFTLIAIALGASLLLEVPASRSMAPAMSLTSAALAAANGAGVESRRGVVRIERALLLVAAAVLVIRLGGSVGHLLRDADAFVGYDDLSYHLPAAAVWWQNGDLRTLKQEIGDPSPTFYPITAELCSWALLAPLHGNDVAARRTQLPFALGSLLAMAAIGRRLRMRRAGVALALLLYGSVDRAFPVLALGAGNDHCAGFFTLAALDAALAFLAVPGPRAAAYLGCALGLLAGTKYIGLYFALTVLVVMAALWAIGRLRLGSGSCRCEGSGGGHGAAAPAEAEAALAGGGGAAALAWSAAALVGCALLCGGYAYVRNAVVAGNPVFPEPITILGRRLLPGWSWLTLASRRQLPAYRIDTVSFLIRRPDLFGPLFVCTLLPAALVAPGVAAWRRLGLPAVLFCLPVVWFLIFRFLMHDHRDLRYFLPALAVAALAAAWLLHAVGGAWGAGLRALALGGVTLAALSHLRLAPWQAVLVVAVLAALALAALALAARGRWRSPVALPGAPVVVLLIVLIALIGSVWLLAGAAARYTAVKFSRQPAAAALDAASASGSRVAYVGSNQPYLFFGARLQNQVEIVPTDGDSAAEYYTWGGDVRFPFDRPSEIQWRANLAARRIQFVVAARSAHEGPERSWMMAAPEMFSPVFRDEYSEVWRVSQAGGPSIRPAIE